MSTKKDKFNKKDHYFMSLAINLAKNKKNLTGTNPSVGCVIVKNDKVVAFGSTNFNGRPHAETIALQKNKNNNKGSTLYVSLEPCSHYGKTPPCTKAIIKSKIKRVIYSIEDNDIRSHKKSKKILKSKKISVQSGLLSKETKKFYKIYNYVKKNNKPYIIGKLACFSDLSILKNKTHITNEYSRKVSHLLRYENQGILTTYKTINNDNPKLTCRIDGLENFSPTKIIIDRDLKIKQNSYVLNKSKFQKTIIFHNSKNLKKINFLKKRGTKLIKINTENDNYFDLKKIFKIIYDIGIHSILIESGKIFINKILSKNLFNEFYLFMSNRSLRNTNKVNISDVKRSLNIKFKSKNLVNTYLDKDKLLHYY